MGVGNVWCFWEWRRGGGWCGGMGEEGDIDDFVVEIYNLMCWKESGKGMEDDVLIGVDRYEGWGGWGV